jgi:hypothetical protein
MILQLPPTLSPAQLARDFGYYEALSRFYIAKGRPLDAEATHRAAMTKLRLAARITRKTGV